MKVRLQNTLGIDPCALFEMRRFGDETGVFGLSLIASRISKPERVLWALLTLAFFVATLHDVLELVRTFVAEETLMKIESHTAETFVLDPSPNLAFHLTDEFVEDLDPWDNDTLFNDFRESLRIRSRSKFDASLQADNSQLFRVSFRLLTFLVAGELPNLYKDSLVFSQSEKDVFALTIDFYRQQKVSLRNIQRMVAYELCDRIGMHVVPPWEVTLVDVGCPNLHVNELVVNRLSVKFTESRMEFRNRFEFLWIEVNRRDVAQISIDLRAMASSWNIDNSNGYIQLAVDPDHVTSQVNLRIDTVHKRLSRRQRPCTKQADSYCIDRCIAERFRTCSRCYPLHTPFHLGQ